MSQEKNSPELAKVRQGHIFPTRKEPLGEIVTSPLCDGIK